MSLIDKYIKQFAFFYLACFLASYGWHFYNGLLFSSIQPVFFLNKLDFTRNILMLSNLQHLLLGNGWLLYAFDIIYLLLPVLLTVAVAKKIRFAYLLAIITAAFSFVYMLFFTGISYNSPEGYVGWVFVPLIFAARSTRGFYYYLHIVRIIFILMFFSAGLWKIKGAGLFTIEEMSGILIKQHNGYLAANADDWYTHFLQYLIGHRSLSYLFYLLATVAELLYVIGLVTRKYDRWLIVVFCLFVVLDYLLMGINYSVWLVFMGCFYFSAFSLPAKDVMNKKSE